MFDRIYKSNYQLISEKIFKPVDRLTITVAVSLYNYERYLVDCLGSILGQRYENLDLIIVDDCSNKDSSLDCARNWLLQHADRFRRATLMQHRRNQGLAQARNTAFEHSRSDAVFVIDADNLLYPRAVEALAPFVIDRGYGAAYSQIEIFGESTGLGAADYWDKRFFVKGNYVDAMALVSKHAWSEIRGYTHLEGGWEDYDFWCKFMDAELDAIFVPQILCRYRVHSTSMLRTETKDNDKDLRTEMTLRHPWVELLR